MQAFPSRSLGSKGSDARSFISHNGCVEVAKFLFLVVNAVPTKAPPGWSFASSCRLERERNGLWKERGAGTARRGPGCPRALEQPRPGHPRSLRPREHGAPARP